MHHGETAVVDKGGPSCITFDAFKHFIVETARTQVFAFISAYVAGGFVGHRYVDLYGPDAVDVKQTILIENARDRELNLDVARGNNIDCTAARRMIDTGVIPDTLGSDVPASTAGPWCTGRPAIQPGVCHGSYVGARLGLPIDHVVRWLRNPTREFTDSKAMKPPSTVAFLPKTWVASGRCMRASR